ncbi:ATP-binding cassette domain-containing protein [Plastorhodobacter daqingensis]|uniref:ATP-binding cassette domain-containing protein n=1 Tax=Plastorhodobacter daqingensis TaxID=1387281 RepID=A0ABW2UMD4_9RHOB
MNGLVLQGLTIRRDGVPLVDLDLCVGRGEIATIMGPSGSGKSTLLAAIIGDLAPPFVMTGRIELNGRDLSGLSTQRRRVGILFQDDVLFPHLSVAGNLAFALPATVRGRAARRRQVEEALESAGLVGLGGRDPATLSGGQRARVALMRTLLAEPEALLLDEPFSRLDAARRAQIRSFVFERAREWALPVLLVTHDAEDAAAAGGPILDPLGRSLSA